MGTNFTYDSPCWELHVFYDKEQRDNWVWENKYQDGNLVAEIVTVDEAVKIAGRKALDDIRNNGKWCRVESEYRVVMHGVE